MSGSKSMDDLTVPIALGADADPNGTLGLDPQRLNRVPYLLLDAARHPNPLRLLGAVRQHPATPVYLKPVLMLNAGGHLAAAAADAHLDGGGPVPEHLHQQLERLDRQARAIASEGKGDPILLRLLRYIASRNDEFLAVPTIRNRHGYTYPRLEPFLSAESESGLSLLQLLEEQKLVQGRFLTRAHTCTHCGCAFLNFQEICPHCESMDIESDDLVHHFRCGYVAELRDFQREEGFVCPKCDRVLRQIGVDYDKPSVMFRCRQCAHDFQEPTVTTFCYDCQRSTPPEHQVQQRIAAYRVTALGRAAAALGLDSLFSSTIEQRLKLCPWSAFASFVGVEAARIKRYGRSTSSLLLFRIEAIDRLYLRLGRRARQVFEELANVIVGILRSSDLISARNEGLFAVLLTETDLDQARRAAERLREGVDDLLRDGFDAADVVRTQVLAVDEGLRVDQAVEAFAADHGT